MHACMQCRASLAAAAHAPPLPPACAPQSPTGRELRRNWQRQVILETKALDATRARYQKEQLSAFARGQAASLPEARQMLLRWFGPVTAAIQKEQQRVRLSVALWRGI